MKKDGVSFLTKCTKTAGIARVHHDYGHCSGKTLQYVWPFECDKCMFRMSHKVVGSSLERWGRELTLLIHPLLTFQPFFEYMCSICRYLEQYHKPRKAKQHRNVLSLKPFQVVLFKKRWMFWWRGSANNVPMPPVWLHTAWQCPHAPLCGFTQLDNVPMTPCMVWACSNCSN